MKWEIRAGRKLRIVRVDFADRKNAGGGATVAFRFAQSIFALAGNSAAPGEAIFAEDDVPSDQQQFKALNAELSKVWKPIIERKPAPPDADEWKAVTDKRNLLET